MKSFKLILSVLMIVSLLACSSFAIQNEIKPSPNYFIILIPGVGGDDKSFKENYGKLEKYLRNALDLEGYVYGYDFPDFAGDNFENAKRLADPSNEDSWFKKAKKEFITWFTNKKGISPEAEEIPDKYILIAHSLGGTKENVHRISLSGKW